MFDQYQVLLSYLADNLNMDYEVVVPRTYIELLQLYEENKLDLVRLGGATFLRAHSTVGTKPLVGRLIDSQATTSIVVHADSKIANLEDLKGKQFAFGPNLSTSGHLIPSRYLQSYGIDPKRDFTMLKHARSKDQVLIMIRDRIIDAGAVSTRLLEKMKINGEIKPDVIRVLWTSPVYMNYLWVAHPTVSEAARQKLQQAFLALDNANTLHKQILNNIDASTFQTVSADDYKTLEMLLGMGNGLSN